MSALLEAVDYCRNLLLADSLLMNGSGSINGVDSRVFWELAPGADVQSYPMVIGNLNAGSADNSAKIRMMDLRIQWVAISQVFAEAEYLGNRIYRVLHEANPADKTDWVVFRSQLIQPISLMFKDGEKRFYRSGGIYRIRLNESR